MPNFSKSLDISSATFRVSPELLKTLAILSDTTVRRSAVDREDLKSYWKSKKDLISLGDQQAYYLQDSLNRGGIADLLLLRTLLAIRQVSRAKFLGSDRFF